MAKLKRRFSQSTLKILFGLSGNQCAHPTCKNPVIVPPTEKSKERVLNQICHIYALNEDGPRGKAGLIEKELNAPENLILFCPTHHVIIDVQYETYPAEMLLKWKQVHTAKFQSARWDGNQPDDYTYRFFPTDLVDKTICEEVELLRRRRFYSEIDTIRVSSNLAARLIDGELSGGTSSVRSRALAWCSRFLSPVSESQKAQVCLDLAMELGDGSEIKLADAFMLSQKGEMNAALSVLAKVASPTSRTAALMITAHHEGTQGAVDRLSSAGIKATNLDSEGKYVLLANLLSLSRWEAAEAVLNSIDQGDLREAPILHQTIAMTHLLTTVPDELRSRVATNPLFETARFPLASDAVAIQARRASQQCFEQAAQVASQLGCPRAGRMCGEYALWLELKDPEKSQNGKRQLEERLRDTESALGLVHLCSQFGIKLDPDVVEREIERQIALNGEITEDAAIARFSLAITRRTPEDVANYIDQYFDELTVHLNKKAIRAIQIEVLSKAGLLDRANTCLDSLLADGLSEADEDRLRREIAEAKGVDPITALKEQFANTDALDDLLMVLDELQNRNDWNGVREYGEEAFERTGALSDAERLVNALDNSREYETLVEFLSANTDLLGQSKRLRLSYCWALYFEGELLKARSELAKLSDERNDPGYRALQVSLEIALGDWNSLAASVANEYSERENRNAQDLLRTARLAHRLNSPHAKELTVEAARRGGDDAKVLTGAYFLATSAGWEGEAEVKQWLQRAAELSGDDGPIQIMGMKDVLDQKPEWDRRESDIWERLTSGKSPMFLAAESLGRSLIDLMLVPALANRSEKDPRRRGSIPAFRGNIQPARIEMSNIIGIDSTALLTLSYLNLLDEALDAFETIYMPHSTLEWLFEERGHAAFHQPSRVRDSHQVRHFLSTGALECLTPSTVPDSELSSEVGDDLALMIAEAKLERENEPIQRIVVCSPPVYRIAFLMEEEADLVAHESVLTSCQLVVDKLRQTGHITSEEERRARAYLKLREKPWPHQSAIEDGAILYLDDIALSHFLHLGILESLSAAGLRPIVSSRKVREANELILYERNSDRVSIIIENIRLALNSRIESGRVKVGRRRTSEAHEGWTAQRHPSFELLDLAIPCDAIVVDDRFFNGHPNVDDGAAQAKIFSTLDILDALCLIGTITPAQRMEHRTSLRRGGYLFIPVDDDELKSYLLESKVDENRVIETAELRAIRENILQIRMRSVLQHSAESPWLDGLFQTLVRVLHSLWAEDADLSHASARSDWLFEHIDARGWAHTFDDEIGENLVNVGRVAHIVLLLLPPTDSPPEIGVEYWSWVETRILGPLKEQFPELYDRIVEWQRNYVAEIADTDLTEEDLS